MESWEGIGGFKVGLRSCLFNNYLSVSNVLTLAVRRRWCHAEGGQCYQVEMGFPKQPSAAVKATGHLSAAPGFPHGLMVYSLPFLAPPMW